MPENKNSFYSEDELKDFGFKKIGGNVLLSRRCSIYGAENISIGDSVRIDDFVLLSGNITIGNYIHISAGTYLYGGDAGIYLNDYCTISARCCIYAVSDNYLGEAMTNPMVPEEFREVKQQPVIMEKHVIVGAGSVVLPGVHLEEGSAFGSMSMITKSSKPWTVYKGVPAREWKERGRKPLEMESYLNNDNNVLKKRRGG